ncbi:hypothetical protein MNBD_GAMMA06-1114 [hydrothermal vent metagenome]|uniref:Uncharacterized protein n=1 Tax=hydrothermal vent metagenome TaxID=652676 RepID=A0A3B0WUD9_9ZZZZ
MKSLFPYTLFTLAALFSNAQAATIFEIQSGVTVFADSVTGSSGDFYDQTFSSFAASSPTNALAASVTGNDLTTYAWTPNAHLPANPAVERAYIDLSFTSGIYNGEGDDLVLFFAGNGSSLSTGIEEYLFSVSIGEEGAIESAQQGVITSTTSSIYDDAFFASYAFLDLDDFGFGQNAKLNDIRIYLDDTSMPALAGLGAYYDRPAVVPVPAAVWLFGSGLALLSLFKRKNTPKI